MSKLFFHEPGWGINLSKELDHHSRCRLLRLSRIKQIVLVTYHSLFFYFYRILFSFCFEPVRKKYPILGSNSQVLDPQSIALTFMPRHSLAPQSINVTTTRSNTWPSSLLYRHGNVHCFWLLTKLFQGRSF